MACASESHYQFKFVLFNWFDMLKEDREWRKREKRWTTADVDKRLATVWPCPDVGLLDRPKAQLCLVIEDCTGAGLVCFLLLSLYKYVPCYLRLKACHASYTTAMDYSTAMH